MLAAYCARRGLHIFFLRLFWCPQSTRLHYLHLTVFLFYLDYWQFVNLFNRGFIFLTISLGFLFWYSANYFEDIVTWIELRLVVVHEVRRWYTIHCLLHSQELVTREKMLESLKHSIDCSSKTINLSINQFLLISRDVPVFWSLKYNLNTIYCRNSLLLTCLFLSLLTTSSNINNIFWSRRELYWTKSKVK